MPAIELPIFPLPLVLFPGTQLPLHIFEPRYRRMLADSLAGDHRFGISMVETGAERDPAPRPGDVGCIAVIHSCRQLPDGRSDILTTGGSRYVLTAYLDRDCPYRVARVEPFDDEPGTTLELGELPERVRAEFDRLRTARQALDAGAPGNQRLPIDPTALSFSVAAALPVEPPVKQALLVGRSTRARLEALVRLLGPLARELAARAAVHQRARLNGHGGRHRAEAGGG